MKSMNQRRRFGLYLLTAAKGDADRPTCACPADYRHAGFAECHDHRGWQLSAESAGEIWRRDQPERQGFQAVLAAEHRAAQGRAERAADHDRRPGLRHLAAPLAASFRRPTWIASPRWGCATRSFTPPRSARRRGRRSSPGAITTPSASASSPNRPPASPATTPRSA